MGDLFFILYKYYMKIQEAQQILHKNGFMLEGSMSLKDKIDNAVKQTEKIKMDELEKALKKHPQTKSVSTVVNHGVIEMYLHTNFNDFTIYWEPDYKVYDIFPRYQNDYYESFKTPEDLIKWVYED